MTIQRMDNVLIVVDDLEAAKAFFAELGMELEGETTVEGPWVDSTVGLDGVRADIAMLRTPDGQGRVELTKFHTPPARRAGGETQRAGYARRSRPARARGPGFNSRRLHPGPKKPLTRAVSCFQVDPRAARLHAGQPRELDIGLSYLPPR